MKHLDVVLIHGFWSSRDTWDSFARRARADRDLAGVELHAFSYESPKVGLPFSTVRIPDYNDIAQSLPAYLANHTRADADVILVAHSQGGLIVQRFFAWMLSEGRARELTRVKLAILLSCPNEGSEFLRSIRAVLGFGRHPQARDLAALSKDVADTRRVVMRQIVYATAADDRHCRIPVRAYSGRSDKVVDRASAQSTFPEAAVLPGDHFSILDMDAPNNLTYSEIKRLLLSVQSGPASRNYTGGRHSGIGGISMEAAGPTIASRAAGTGTGDTFRNASEEKGDSGATTGGGLVSCSFCEKSQDQVRWLVQGGPDGALMCNECIDLSAEVMDEQNADTRALAVTRICELTVQLAGDMPPAQRLAYQEELDKEASKARPGRRPRPDDELAGARLVRIVGAGNFGTVWQASIDGEPCAVKIFDSDKITIGLMLWRFQRGIRAMRHLTTLADPKPSSVCRLWDVSPDRLAFSMPYLPGGDLSNLSRRGWSARKKRAVFVKVAEAVEYAHRNGVVHRDIKPANIVLDVEHEPVLTDFDIADLSFAATQSVAAASLGTPSFAAPEQLEGQLVASPTADIFSLGKLLSYLVTENPPPLGATSPGRVNHDSYLLAGLPNSTLREIVGRCIEILPEGRFQNVEELLAILPASFDVD